MFKPALAVRGLNCMMCHANIQSNVITDFGYGSPNFYPTQLLQLGAKKTFVGYQQAFSNDLLAWQSAKISGSVFIPKAPISSDDALGMFGVAQNTSLKEVFEQPSLSGGTVPMLSGITPLAGSEALYEKDVVKIAPPTEADIQHLLPAAAASQAIYFGLISSASDSVISGLSADASGKFIRNSSRVTCRGDVVIKGPLLLKNLELETNAKGCRLYVTGTVFIQGAIQYFNSNSVADQNLQIASGRAVILGLSLARMGANLSGTGSVRIAKYGDNHLTTPGNRSERFAMAGDLSYAPGMDRAATRTFFDNIVLDGMPMLNELKDAADPTQVANPPAGMSVVNGRLATDYRGLFLAAPQVHSRYEGNFHGAIIADVAMFNLLDTSPGNARFTYDPVFDRIDLLFPSIRREMLSVK